MSSVTRTPACTVKGCPWPKDPDWHVPICGHGLEGHHHHVTKRSQGGKDGPQVFICPDCHRNIDEGEWGNDIKDIPGRGKVYFAWDLHGNTLIERGINGQESPRPTAPPAEGSGDVEGVAGAQQESEEAEGEGSSAVEHQSYKLAGAGSNPAPPTTLTHEQRVAIAQEIRDAQQRRQFLAGDYANNWEEELGEDFWNLYANEFGYTYPSLRNVMRVCKAIPASQRHDEMSFAHHEAVKTFDIETRDAWLERAFEEEWPVKRLREELVAEGLLTAKPKVKRWTTESLLEEVERWPAPRERLRPRGAVKAYLAWLREQT